MSDWVLWGVSLLTICGSILNIKKINLCFWIWSLCNVFWLIFDIKNKTYSRAVLDLINLSTSVWGIVEWHKQSISNKKDNGNDNTNIENSKSSDTVESV